MSPPSMMVPRSYTYTAEKKSRVASQKTKKVSELSTRLQAKDDGWSDKRATVSTSGGNRQTRSEEPGKPKRITSITRSSPSEPVVIPTRTSSPKKSQQESTTSSARPNGQNHDSSALSPSMAALLAMTSIPRTRARAIKRAKQDRLSPNDFRQSVSSTSPHSWSILQSPPDGSDTDMDKNAEFDIEIGSIESLSTLEAENITMYRSLSSDSIPSLDVENGMFNSPESPPMPRTPSSRRGKSPLRAKSPRREKVKTLSSSEPLAAGELHPLALDEVLDDEDSRSSDENSTSMKLAESEQSPPSRDRSPAAPAPSQFRSNLTASLQRLKKVARSISLPTPSVSTVLAINSRVLPEKSLPSRPRSPLPLNNSAFSQKTSHHLSLEDKTRQPLASDLYFSSTPSEEYRPIASSIQLQSYLRRESDDPLLDKATAPPVFLSSTPAPPILLPGVDSPRPREPRENRDFLRVVVLEMNMRRAGKLDNVGGRARIWIGPRAEKAKSEPVEEATTSKVPRAERGMSDLVASELAEAMMVDGEEASMARSLQKDDDSKSFDAEVHVQMLSRRKQSSSKGDVPSRWKSAFP